MASGDTLKSTPTWLGVGAIVGLVGAVYHVEFRPAMLRWGASDDELALALPGDELVADPTFVSTRAITINAPPAHVWPQLLADVHDLRRRSGDDIVAAAEYEYLLVGMSRSFVLEPLGVNRTRLIVRFRGVGWVRRRFAGYGGLRELGALIDYVVGEPVHHFTEREMMLGLARRAETAWAESL